MCSNKIHNIITLNSPPYACCSYFTKINCKRNDGVCKTQLKKIWQFSLIIVSNIFCVGRVSFHARDLGSTPLSGYSGLSWTLNPWGWENMTLITWSSHPWFLRINSNKTKYLWNFACRIIKIDNLVCIRTNKVFT